MVCPTCGSNHLKKRGFNLTKVGKYQRYQCGDCGTWASERTGVKLDDLVVKGV